MSGFFKKISLSLSIVIVSINSAFSCINDEYTTRSETNWGNSYDYDIKNFISFLVIVSIISFVLSETYHLYKKDLSWKELHYTIGIGIITSLIIFFRIFGGMMISGALLAIVTMVYMIYFIYHLCLLIIKNIKSYDVTNLIFMVSVLGYLVYFYRFAIEPHTFYNNLLILVILTLIILVFSLFNLDAYRFRTYSVVMIMFLIIFTVPLYSLIYEDVFPPDPVNSGSLSSLDR